jgi:hypothetical protein
MGRARVQEALQEQMPGADSAWLGRAWCAGSSGSPDMEVSVAPAPGPDGDILVVTNSVQRGVAGCGSAEDEMSDMMDDAVMLEFEAAEQLVELQRQLEQQLTLAEGPKEQDGSGAAAAAAAAEEGHTGPAADGLGMAAGAALPANGRAPAAEKQVAAPAGAASEEDVPPEFNQVRGCPS